MRTVAFNLFRRYTRIKEPKRELFSHQAALIMDFNDIEVIRKEGFLGFKRICELFSDCSSIPKVKGVYLVLNPHHRKADFLQIGTGGYFKGRNPNVDLADLKRNWVDNSLVVYIGKAGSDTGKATLHSRLKQYCGFGQGKNIGHWGGRLIWQLRDSSELIVCWKALPDGDPRGVEKDLIGEFVSTFGKRPFANLAD
jgi:hypothetical protein